MVSKQNQQLLLQLARKTIASFLEGHTLKTNRDIPAELQQKKGVFVTLTQNNQLRGCIGQIKAIQTIWDSVQQNALNAAFNDPRFPPVSTNELSQIKIEISILSTPQALAYKSPSELLEKLMTNKHGVILQNKNGTRNATFLPSVWHEIPDKKMFLSHLCLKAGLEPTAWQDAHTRISVYTAKRFEEKH